MSDVKTQSHNEKTNILTGDLIDYICGKSKYSRLLFDQVIFLDCTTAYLWIFRLITYVGFCVICACGSIDLAIKIIVSLMLVDGLFHMYLFNRRMNIDTKLRDMENKLLQLSEKILAEIEDLEMFDQLRDT